VGDSTAASQGVAAGSSDVVARAHAALLKQSDIQFVFKPVVIPEPPPWLKKFLEAFGHLLVAVAPAFKYIFWGGIIIGAVIILYFLFWELAAIRFGWRRRTRPEPVKLDQAWTPSAAKARTLIEDADRLAAEGRYDAAVHVLLFRSIEDIDQRWPGSVAPALTSRDIIEHPRLSDAARRIFADLARVVERSFFGGAPVGEADFKACRQAYSAFALPAGA
jgi:hypothetical protein